MWAANSLSGHFGVFVVDMLYENTESLLCYPVCTGLFCYSQLNDVKEPCLKAVRYQLRHP
jgi:hypothetical protein